MNDTKVCSECGKTIERKRRRVCCSDPCAKARKAKQITAYGLDRRGKKRTKQKTCVVCGRVFTPASNNQVYCIEVECRDEGLRRAVGRQRERRQLAKEAS